MDWLSFCKKVKAAGYDGIEAGVPFDIAEKELMQQAIGQHQLLLIGQYWQSFEKDFETHKASYLKHLYHLASLQPVKIDAQTGKDYFTFEQNKELFAVAAAFTQSSGIPVAHETHRNKALFAAHITQHFLNHIPALQITADFSHWCNVAESFLEDQQDALETAFKHTAHIHARVGHPQAAQVTDPRLPEWKDALHHHLGWWKKIIREQLKNNTTHFTITPEFGPAPYMIDDPVTKKPLANQWDINVWMMQLLKKELF